MTYWMRSVVRVAAVAVAFLGAAGPVVGAEVYNSGGFEPPRFTTASPALEGQDTLGPWLKDAGTATAVVQSTTVQSGSQAVRLDRPASAAGDTRYGVLRPLTPTAPLTLLRVSWDMNVLQTNAPNVNFGPFFGVEGYDAFNNVPKLVGSLGVDASTGEVLIQETGSGSFIPTGDLVPFGQWNRFTLEMDYANKTYRAFVNGVASGDAEPFVDPGITAFTDAPISTLAAEGGAGLAAPGTAFYDNYTIEIVPEPATMAMIGLASLGLLRRRRTA